MPRILVLYNEPVLPPDHPDAESEYDILATVEVVSRTIADAGMASCASASAATRRS